MDATLADFVRVLRGRGVRVSVAELLDAYQAVARVGIADRGVLKTTLAMTLAKSSPDRALFDDAFEHFFALRAQAARAPEPTPPAGAGAAPGAAPGTASQDGAGGAHALVRPLLDADWASLEFQIAAAGQRVGAKHIALFTQRGQYIRAIGEALDLPALDRAVAGLEGGAEADRATAARLRQGRAKLVERIREHVDRHIELYADTAYEAWRREILPQLKLSELDRRDYAAMRALVARMAKRLAALHRRRRKRARRGRLDLSRTLRSSLAYDGVPFAPQWRRTRKDTPRDMILCDVSGSVAAVSRFLLLFLHSVGEALPRVRSFVFCSDLHEVTALFAQLPMEQALALVMERYGHRPTDYGTALRDFEASCLDTIDRRTTVIILGDGRNNGGDPNLPALRRVRERARQLIWLNPEPRSQWGAGDSEMPRLTTACHQARVCNTLKDLERLASELLRSAV